ncbi:hypothetical protein [Psychroflexus sp. MBR-150]
MITDKIKALFQFIEYLHSNIENFNQYNDLIKELEQLDKERNQLKPEQNYKDKLQYNKVQAELESKFKTLQDNTANLIKAKAKELNVCSFENEPRYNFNGTETEIRQLKDNFSNKDLPEIFKHKSQYLEYRSQTHGTFLSLQFFFDKLDELAKSIFDYFKDTEQNEFEPFETKAIEVNSITEAAQRFNKQGQTKFILPTPMNKTKERILNNLADFNFFQIEVIADLEYEGKIYKDVKQRNNDSILTPENWDKHKETFFTQRMATYKESYTLAEKIKLELLSLEKLPINKTDYQILKDRYKAYLKQKQTLPPQQTTTENDNIKYTAKHYVLAYLIECNAKGESFPIGQKKELEKIGSQRIGAGKGHRFYREFNNITNSYDINKPSHLIEIGGENWRTIVKDLSNEPETIEAYLQSKQL